MRWMQTVASIALLTACVPQIDVDESSLGEPRILAVRATPAEAAPGASVTLTALYASRDGVLTSAPIDWAFCEARRPLAELGPYAPLCVAWESDALTAVGVGHEVTGSVPRDACRLFGPDPPPAMMGEPAGRVVDPDPTGGYRAPLRLIEPDDDAIVMAELRVTCGVAGATQAVSAEFRRRYRINQAPSPEAVTVVFADGREATAGELPISVSPGESVQIRVDLPACPEEDVCGDGICGVDEDRMTCAGDCGAGAVGCGGRERYLRYDPESRSIVVQRESLRAAWYATGGSLALERNGLGPDEPLAPLENTFVAPSEPGPLTLVVVLRDARGAADWRTVSLSIE